MEIKSRNIQIKIFASTHAGAGLILKIYILIFRVISTILFVLCSILLRLFSLLFLRLLEFFFLFMIVVLYCLSYGMVTTLLMHKNSSALVTVKIITVIIRLHNSCADFYFAHGHAAFDHTPVCNCHSARL